jgi:NADH:ubiquinone oxidoreductase subunit 3 (subunit A)
MNFEHVFLFFLFSALLSLLIFFLSYLFIPKWFESEKISAYECGFVPFGSSRRAFDVKFYLVAILFIIFDLEIIYLFPWIILIRPVSFFGFCNMLCFLVVLTIGFVYEWIVGALDW